MCVFSLKMHVQLRLEKSLIATHHHVTKNHPQNLRISLINSFIYQAMYCNCMDNKDHPLLLCLDLMWFDHR